LGTVRRLGGEWDRLRKASMVREEAVHREDGSVMNCDGERVCVVSM